MRIKRATGMARWVTMKEWHRRFSVMPEEKRPIVLRIDEHRQLVKIRPKHTDEIVEVLENKGLVRTQSIADRAEAINYAASLKEGL